MPYELYKLIHLAAIFTFLTSAAVLLVANPPGRAWKMLTGISSAFILLAGMAMLGKLQVGMPPWAMGKLVIWLFLTGFGHLVAKRFPSRGKMAYVITLVGAVAAAALVIYKPGS